MRQNKYKIMLIDDNDIDNYISEHIITKHLPVADVAKFDSARNGLEYLQSCAENQSELPEAIFLDINMPDMDGFGFLEKFKLLPESVKSSCRIAMLTSSNNTDDYNRSMNYPYVKEYFEKPLTTTKLDSIIGLLMSA